MPVELFGTIKEGMQVEVTPEHYGDAAHRAIVTLVDKVIDPASGTFDVRAELPNPDHSIPSGLRCTALFLDEPPESSSIANADTGSQDSGPLPAGSDTQAWTNNDKSRLESAAVPTPAQACSVLRESIVHNYRVLANPRANNTVTGDLVNQLLSRGIYELHVVTTGQNQGHVALGLYQQQQPAEERLAELSRLGFNAEMNVNSEIKTETICIRSQNFAGRVGTHSQKFEPGPARSAPRQRERNDEPRLERAVVSTPVPECSVADESIVHSYRVLADPRANDTVTRDLVNQLKARGIYELYVIAAGENRGQVSLGLYRQKHYAEKRLAEVAMLGFQIKMNINSETRTASVCKDGQQFAAADFH